MAKPARVSDDVAPDQMLLRDDFVPGIVDGTYRIAAQHSVKSNKGEAHYYRDQTFVVQGPRYALPGGELHAFFPPAGGTSDYQRILPHAVLGKRALPWERQIWKMKRGAGGDYDRPPEPWLALLVLSEQQIEQAVKDLGAEGGGPQALLRTMTPHDLFQPTGNPPPAKGKVTENGRTILLPELDEEGESGDAETRILMLDLPLETFQAVCPQKQDLPYLAHLRCVDVLHKAKLDMHAAGDFPVLLANRFPEPGTNTVFLVSLEGWKDLIDPAEKNPRHGDWVRLVTMAHWSFNNDEGIHTFGELVEALSADALRVPPPSEHGAGAKVEGVLHRGFVPVEYRPLASTRTFAWYRGPFTVVRPAALPGKEPISRADEALIFDPDTGVFDLSYASAWQLGRLLALASPTARQGLRTFLDGGHDAFDAAAHLETFLEHHAGDVGRHWTARVRGAQAKAAQSDSDTFTAAFASRLELATPFLGWLARLALLEPVPFHYLVADERLLPRESLRFFYLDDGWIECLVEGALSAGADCWRDHDHAQGLREEIREAVSKLVYQYRLEVLEEHYLRLQQQGDPEALKHVEAQIAGIVDKQALDNGVKGVGPSHTPKTDYFGTVKSGFLLRSDLVQGWPGMEIRIYADQAKTQELTPLRMEHLSEKVLLCIVKGEIASVDFKEPLEGIKFGVDAEGKVGKEGGEKRIATIENETMKLQATYARGEGGVLKVDALGTALDAGPAGFGYQLMRRPQDRTFNWGK